MGPRLVPGEVLAKSGVEQWAMDGAGRHFDGRGQAA